MFGKKKEQSVETNGIVYRRAKTWRVALAGCSSGIGMCFYVLLGLASYVANEGYGIATAVVGIILQQESWTASQIPSLRSSSIR